MMNCNEEIHDELKSMEYITCSFCDQQLQDHTVKYESGCENMTLENTDGVYVCINCGQVDRYDIAMSTLIFMISIK